MSQIALPLDWPPAEDERDFILAAPNRDAVALLGDWRRWPVRAALLTGPRKSGRSLLARIFAAESGAALLDDAHAVAEEAIFHAWNRAQESGRPLLIVADAPPPAWEVRLPDLLSRLAASPKAAIRAPDEALAAGLIERRLAARGLPVPADVVRYLVPRAERSYIGIHRLIDALDGLALARRQGISVPLARAALMTAGVIDRTPGAE
ncbi:MAG: DnaA/Hda family protein [Sphingomonas fennica]